MRFPELSRYSEGCLLTFSAALLVSAATIYVTSVNGGYLGGYQVVDWSQQLEGLHEKKSGVTARKSPTYEGHEMPTHLPIEFVSLPKEMPPALRTAACTSHDADWLLSLAISAASSKVLPRSKLWACSVLYKHYRFEPSEWKNELMLQQDFLTPEYRLYLRDIARTELLESRNGGDGSRAMCQRFFGVEEGEFGTKYLGAGSYGLAFSRTLSQAAALPPPTLPPQLDNLRERRSKSRTKKMEKTKRHSVSSKERAVIKIAGLDKAAHVKSATLAAGFDVSVEGYYQEAMSHIVEAGMPHVAIGYGVWICDQFEKDAGPLNLLYPKLDCKNQHKANINSTLIKHRNKNGKNPSYDERVASCTVLKEEIRTGVMSPNMQVLMLEQVHLGFRNSMKLMSEKIDASMVILAQKTFFFQLVFTVATLQKVFGPTYKHNDLMLGNIRGTFPQWLGDYHKESGYASGGKMAAPMTDNKPLSYFKYKNEGVEYTLPNFGFNLRLADYDFSQSTQNNRTRNPKVEWIKEARPCGRRIDNSVWSSTCRTIKSADVSAESGETTGGVGGAGISGSSAAGGEGLVRQAKAALAILEQQHTLTDNVDFIDRHTSFSCTMWRARGCHNAAEDYGHSQAEIKTLHNNCKKSCTRVDLNMITVTVDGAAVQTAQLPKERVVRSDVKEYRDPMGYPCTEWKGYQCEEYARNKYNFTPEQVTQLLASCPHTCPQPVQDEASVVNSGGHVLVRFGGGGSSSSSSVVGFDGKVLLATLQDAKVGEGDGAVVASRFSVEVTVPMLQSIAKLSVVDAQTLLNGLKTTRICFLRRAFWVQRGPLVKKALRLSQPQEYEIILEVYGMRAGPVPKSVVRLVDPADGKERDYELVKSKDGVKQRGGKSIMTWSVTPYNVSTELYPVDATSITDVEEPKRVGKKDKLQKKTYWVPKPKPWRGHLDGYGYIFRVPSAAPFVHFFQEGIVPTENRRLDIHFVLNAIFWHESTYKHLFKGEVWDWIMGLLRSCDQCEQRMSKTVFESRMANGMQYRYCELNETLGLTTNNKAIMGFPLPEEILSSEFFADFRGEGSWTKAPDARQILDTIDMDKMPTDLGSIHNGALLPCGTTCQTAAPFPVGLNSDGAATGEGAYLVKGGATQDK